MQGQVCGGELTCFAWTYSRDLGAGKRLLRLDSVCTNWAGQEEGLRVMQKETLDPWTSQCMGTGERDRSMEKSL